VNRTRLAGLLAALLVFTDAAATEPVAVSLATDDNHFPYAFMEDGKLDGLYVRIVDRVTRQMPHYRVTVVAVPWKRALRLAEAGDVSGIFPPHRFANQRPYLDQFSDAILSELPVIYCNEETIKARGIGAAGWPDDFRGLTFGVSAGTRMGGERFWSLSEAGEIAVESSLGIVENLRKLGHGRLDCVVNDRTTIRAAVALLGKTEPTLSLADMKEIVVLPAEASYLAMSAPAGVREPFHAAFLAEFNAILKKMKMDGTLDGMVEGYLREVAG